MKRHPIILLAAMAMLLVGCDEPIPSGKVDVRKFASKLRGYHVPQGVVVTQTEQPEWIQAIATGYSASASLEAPQETEFFEEDAESCLVTAPSQNEYVGHVFFAKAKQSSSIYKFSDEDISESTRTFVRRYKDRPSSARRYTRPVSPMQMIDVFVTETSKPVYLVLTTRADAIWNIHKAEGAHISRIVLIGSSNLGVATDKIDTPVEILRCGPPAMRNPKPHWGFVRRLKGARTFDKTKSESRDLYLEFARWYEDNFSVPVSRNLVEANNANHALIGPTPVQPDDRIVYASVEDRTVRLTNGDQTVIADKKSFKNIYLAMVEQLATEIAGGDLAFLRSNQ